jgi:hypothetical protein
VRASRCISGDSPISVACARPFVAGARKRASARSSFAPIDRLGQVIASAAAQRVHARLDRRVAGDDDELGALAQAVVEQCGALSRPATRARRDTNPDKGSRLARASASEAATRVVKPRSASSGSTT